MKGLRKMKGFISADKFKGISLSKDTEIDIGNGWHIQYQFLKDDGIPTGDTESFLIYDSSGRLVGDKMFITMTPSHKERLTDYEKIKIVLDSLPNVIERKKMELRNQLVLLSQF